MFKSNDVEFAEIAADPARRAAAIAELVGRIRRLSLCAGLATACMIGVAIADYREAGRLALGVAMVWPIVFNMDSNLRLLRVVDRLHGDSSKTASSDSLGHSPGRS